MSREILLSIQGRQRYEDQEPETIELVTQGTMDYRFGLESPFPVPPERW